ncbi:MAG: hypothetical protein ACRENP_04055 [Longimicrobiales bacterium]
MMREPAYAGDALIGALRQCAFGVVHRSAPATWRFQLRNGKPLAVRATRSGEWLRLTTAARPERAPDLPWRLLALNAQLPSSAKATFEWRNRSTYVCVDVCLAAEDSSAHRLNAACSSLLEAGASLASIGEDPPLQARDRRLDDAIAEQCCDLLNDGQWSWTERADEHLQIALPTRRGPAQAAITQSADAVCCHVQLVDTSPTSEICRQATSAFLLAATGSLRLVRAVRARKRERETVGIEVMLAPRFTTDDLNTALLGLATASDLLGPEAAALRNDALASEYLAARALERVRKARPLAFTTMEVPEPILQEG